MLPGTPNPLASGIVLALDIGRKKTGIAIGNGITQGARPLTVVKGSRSQQLAQIGDIILQWQPVLVVAGLPTHLDGTPHAMTKYCQYFAKLVSDHHQIKTAMVDERLTTQLAGGCNKDAQAAALILQCWWDENNLM